jgi:hypothetical protein
MPGGIVPSFGLNATDEFSAGVSEPAFLQLSQLSNAGFIEVDFDFNDVLNGYKLIGFVPPLRMIHTAVLLINGAFDGGTLIEIGDTIAHARLMTITENNPGEVNHHRSHPDLKYPAMANIYMYAAAGTPTTGNGKVIIYYN